MNDLNNTDNLTLQRPKTNNLALKRVLMISVLFIVLFKKRKKYLDKEELLFYLYKAKRTEIGYNMVLSCLLDC